MTHLVTVLAPLLEAAAGGGGPAGPGGPAGACGGGSSTTQMLLMMGLVFAIFYFLIIRPGQKREKDRQSMLAALKPGDMVVTGGGIVGKITGSADKFVVVEISPKVRVKVLRAQITGLDSGTSGDDKKGKGGGKVDKGKGRRSSDDRADDEKAKGDEKESAA